MAEGEKRQPARFHDRADLVLEGGGVKGIAHVGAMRALEEQGFTHYLRVARTSAGSIVGALAAAGISATRMFEIMQRLDFREIRDRRGLKRIPMIGKAWSLTVNDGFHDAAYLREFLGNVLAEAGVERFKHLRIHDADDRRHLPAGQDYQLVVMATDITNGCLVRLP